MSHACVSHSYFDVSDTHEEEAAGWAEEDVEEDLEVHVEVEEVKEELVEDEDNEDEWQSLTFHAHVDAMRVVDTSPFPFPFKVVVAACESSLSTVSSNGHHHPPSKPKPKPNPNPNPPKRLTVHEVAESMSHYYDDFNKYANELDILTTYVHTLRGVYTEALAYTEQRHYALTCSAVLLTSLVTLASPFANHYAWNPYFISGCNALATLLFGIDSYLGLESQVKSYLFMANAYEKCETSLELTNNRLAFLKDPQQASQLVLDKLKDIETKLTDIRDIGEIWPPQPIEAVFRVATSINIFSFIQKMETHKHTLLVKFTDLKNETNELLYNLQWAPHPLDHRTNTQSTQSVFLLQQEEEQQKQQQQEQQTKKSDLAVARRRAMQQRILFLEECKEPLKEQLVHYHNAYNQLEVLFATESHVAKRRLHAWFPGLRAALGCFAMPNYLDARRYTNPVIVDYLRVHHPDASFEQEEQEDEQNEQRSWWGWCLSIFSFSSSFGVVENKNKKDHLNGTLV